MYNENKKQRYSVSYLGLARSLTALLLAGLAALPLQAQDIQQGENARQLLDLDTIRGQDPFGNLQGDIKTVCAGLPAGGSRSTVHMASARLQADCNALVGQALESVLQGGDTSAVVNAIEQVANDEVASQGTLGVENSQLQARNVAARMVQVQAGVSAPALTLADFGLSSLAPRTFSVALGVDEGLQAGSGFAKTSIFANGSFYSGEQDPNSFEKSFDWDSYGLTVGVDHRFTDNFFAGVSIGYTQTEGDFDFNGGQVESDNMTASVFGSYYTDGGFYIDGSAGIGNTDYDSDRNIIYSIPGTTVNQVARSSTDGDEVSFSLGSGFHIQSGASTFTPRVRIDYLDTDVDGYDEVTCNLSTDECRDQGNDTAGAGWGLAVADQNIESLRASLGVSWKAAFNKTWGVLLPYASADFVHEFEDDARNVFFCFLEDVLCPGNAGVASSADPFVIRTAAPDENFFMLSGGFVAQLAGGKTAFVNIEHMAGNDDIEYTGITAGLRFEFN